VKPYRLHIPSLLLGFLIILSPYAEAANYLTLKASSGRQDDAQIALRRSGTAAFVNLNAFAAALQADVYSNEQKRTFSFTAGSARLKWTADNVFVQIGDAWWQLPAPVVFQEGSYWAPLGAFLDVLAEAYPSGLDYDRNSGQLTLQPKKGAGDLYGIAYETKGNGTLIRLLCSKKLAFSQPVIRGKSVIFILQQASVDGDMVAKVKPSGVVDKFAWGKDGASIQLTFDLEAPILECTAWQDDETRQIHLTLVTQLVSGQPPGLLGTPSPDDLEAISQQLEREQQKWKVDCVVIDPGHGGKDPGANGVTGLKEKEATLDIALRLKQLLAKNTQLRVVLTREDDRFIGLNERTKRANGQGGKLFISIHCNSLKKGGGSGFETYFLKPARNAKAMEVALRENSVIDYEETTNGYQELTEENYILLAMAQSEFVRESEGLAAIVQKKMLLNTGLKDRGVDQAGFYVLVGASMPAILVETAFLSSKHEEKLLKTKKFRQQVAQALYESVLDFMKQSEVANRNVTIER